MTIAGDTSALQSPLDVARRLHRHADEARRLLEPLQAGDNKELEVTLHDIRTMASLGRYYAYKIAGATQLALYRETGDTPYRQAAVAELENALEAWKTYTEQARQRHINPIWTNRVGQVNWLKVTEWVANDIELARAEKKDTL